jgi:hypothetical protein
MRAMQQQTSEYVWIINRKKSSYNVICACLPAGNEYARLLAITSNGEHKVIHYWAWAKISQPMKVWKIFLL